jgi:formylglycine-generating enzyme required for sulfatase activity
MKNLAFATLAATLAVNALATPAVTGVSARQRWPWNNLVDVTFTVSGSDSQEDFYRVDVSATYPGVVGDRLSARTLRDEPLVKGDGTYRIVWDMGADAPGLVTSNLTVQVTVAPFGATEPVYMVVDLSSGPESSSYPVHYTFESPDLADDTCRTTELWLRRCPAGTFQMGYTSGDKPDTVPPHTVSLTKPFYIAVFETTQQQWHQVMGTWPSFFSNTTYRATRPVETVSLNNIRGKDKINYNWYASPVSAVRATSFMGRLRARAGTALATADLPTEAQWEYACRAGTTTPTYYSNITGADFWSPARYAGRSKFDAGTSDGDSDTTVGTAKVGSYPANPWGLYDMVGNVLEWCGDGNPFTGTGAWNYESDFSAYTAATPLVDPRTTLPSYNATYYDAWVGRGGSFVLDWYFMSSQRRYQLWDSTGKSWGFRTCVTGQ